MNVDIIEMTVKLRYVAILGMLLSILFTLFDKDRSWTANARLIASFHAGTFYLCTVLYPSGIFGSIPYINFLASPVGAPFWGALVGVHVAATFAGIAFAQWFINYTARKQLEND